MTLTERVHQATRNVNFSDDNIDRLIAFAYYMGCEAKAAQLCNEAADVFTAQRIRAEKCRYHQLARYIQGDIRMIYDPDYNQQIIDSYGHNETVL